MMKLRKAWIDGAVLLFMLAVLLHLGYGRILEHRLDHGYPFGYLAADAFQHQSRSDGVLRLGNFRYEPIQHFIGIYPDFPGYYPPVFLQLAAAWSGLSGLPTYVTAQALPFLTVALAMLLMYHIARRWHPVMALLSLPLFPFLFLSQAGVNAFTWGHWPQVTAQLFLILLVWLLCQPFWNPFLLAAALASIVMGYTAYAPIAALLVAAYVTLALLTRTLEKEKVRALLIASAMALALSLKTLHLFVNILIPTQGEVSVLRDWAAGGGVVHLAEFGLQAWLLVAGAVLSVMLLAKSIRERGQAERWLPLVFPLLMLVLGFTNLIGFGKRAFFLRLLWPIYLSLLVGVTLYHVGLLVGKKLTEASAAAISLGAILFIALTATASAGGSIMSPEMWQLLSWLRDTTPQDAKLFFFYGDEFIGDNLWNVHRYHLRVMPEAVVEALVNRSARRFWSTTINSDTLPFTLVPADHHKENPFIWGWSANNSYEYLLLRERDMCEQDYLIFVKHSRQPVFAQYGQYLASKLLENPWFTLAFENDYGIVLRNSMPGASCIKEGPIEAAP